MVKNRAEIYCNLYLLSIGSKTKMIHNGLGEISNKSLIYVLLFGFNTNLL
jgi:hypothetical protein